MHIILHDCATAEIKLANTLTNPLFLHGDQLKTFDYVVAGVPLSESKWSTGLTPETDPWQCFKAYGVPPAKQGDYAQLLHIIRLCEARVVDTHLAMRNWLFGGYIIEYDQQGADRGESRRPHQAPLVLEFLGLEDRPIDTGDELESAIIDPLQTFLLELGKGFLFEARQKRFTFDNDHFRVDLVFYSRLLRCYALIDLKRDRLTHQDLGQMQMYVNYFDRHVKQADELPTSGTLLCHRKNDALVELTLPSDADIFVSKYQLYQPSRDGLKAELKQITRDLDKEAQP